MRKVCLYSGNEVFQLGTICGRGGKTRKRSEKSGGNHGVDAVVRVLLVRRSQQLSARDGAYLEVASVHTMLGGLVCGDITHTSPTAGSCLMVESTRANSST